MFVFALGDELKQVAVNQVTADKEVFRGSPAVSNGHMVIRSAKFLYCVADKGETVDPNDTFIAKADDTAAAPPSQTGPGGGGNRRFDPMSMFNGMDRNKDGKVTMDELEGNRMADRLKTLDKDGDKAISKTEFTTGISTLFSGGGNYGRGKDARPDRPQRPASAGK
jgi:outer membrane protein assembly factor BamB